MSACPAWCRSTHTGSGTHQRHWLIGQPVGVSLVFDGEPGSVIEKPKVMICARGDTGKGLWPPLLPLQDATYMAEVFRCLGHADVADAIAEAVSTAKEVA